MSSFIVDVCEIRDKKVHPNADRLEIITVKGWDVIVQKALDLQVGQKVVYFPPDTVMPDALADRLGITKYLSPLRKHADGTREPGLRVRAARLRGIPSFGTIDHEVDPAWEIGQDVRDHFGVRKWEPPLSCLDGDAEKPHPRFPCYTDMENVRNFPAVLKDGEEVVVTEKLHGMNGRWGLVYDADEVGNATHVWMAGSHAVRRKQTGKDGRTSNFWKPFQDPALVTMIEALQDHYGPQASVVVYGELINTQKGFRYGVTPGEVSYRVFDIAVDLKYLDAEVKLSWCLQFGVPMVPMIYTGPFSWAVLETLTTGPTMACTAENAGAFAGREGVVVTPAVERFSPDLPGSGRVILKSISVDYIEHKTKKGAEDVDVSDA